MKKSKGVLGIDIGGTGIKMGLTNVSNGKLLTKRFKHLTPQPATPKAVAKVIGKIMGDHFPDYKGIVGCGFPAIIKKGVAWSATNVDESWFKKNIAKYFKKEFNRDFYVANDADVLARVAANQPGGRFSDPFEQAQAAVWLCSDRASFVNGLAMSVDNGATVGATVNLADG